tara:strand:+ start:45 stop:731 length:687 start_codon:yes stop_codon:yes gene_type:complete
MTRYVTNTNTSTATATSTSTSTNTNTTTNTATKTYGTDADSDGFLQTSEITSAGTDFLFVDEADNQTANFVQDITQNFDQIVYLGADGPDTGFFDDGTGERYYTDGTDYIQEIVQEIPIFNPTSEVMLTYAEAEAFYGGLDTQFNADPNISQDDYTTDLGNNRTIIEVLGDGYVLLQTDMVQNFDQDIVQDVFYETELIQDIVQEVSINQTYTVDVLKTETRTRLVGE